MTAFLVRSRARDVNGGMSAALESRRTFALGRLARRCGALEPTLPLRVKALYFSALKPGHAAFHHFVANRLPGDRGAPGNVKFMRSTRSG